MNEGASGGRSPETPEEQAEEARRCYDAGACMVHVHARDPETGYARPARRKEDFLDVNRLIRAKCPNIIIDNTSGGGMGLTLEERLSSLDANPETSDIDMGPFTVSLKLKRRLPPLTGRDQDEVLSDILPITVEETEERARRMRERGIKVVPGLFHSGHWSLVHNLINKGLLEPPYTFVMMLGMHVVEPADTRSLSRHAERGTAALPDVRDVGRASRPADVDSGNPDRTARDDWARNKPLPPARRTGRQQRPLRRAHSPHSSRTGSRHRNAAAGAENVGAFGNTNELSRVSGLLHTAIAAKMASTVHAAVKYGEPYRPFLEGVNSGGRTPV